MLELQLTAITDHTQICVVMGIHSNWDSVNTKLRIAYEWRSGEGISPTVYVCWYCETFINNVN